MKPKKIALALLTVAVLLVAYRRLGGNEETPDRAADRQEVAA